MGSLTTDGKVGGADGKLLVVHKGQDHKLQCLVVALLRGSDRLWDKALARRKKSLQKGFHVGVR